MAKKKEKLSEPHFIFTKKSEFGFAHYENAQRVAMAFALARHPVSIRQEGSSYIVEIYNR